ncbi:MAG: hypothetical protein NC350_04705 [Corallococcus sp.]|nr:hypothetical protein [Corallococcus sp.]
MKTFSKILAVILAVLLVAVAVIGLMEMPEAEEGAELTKAQKVIVILKTYLNEILATFNLSLGAFLLAIFNTISRQSQTTAKSAAATDGQVAELVKSNEKLLADSKEKDGKIKELASKLDVLMCVLSETLLLSDLPVTVREKITAYKAEYDKLASAANDAVKAVETATAVVVEVADKLSEEKETTAIAEDTAVVARF